MIYNYDLVCQKRNKKMPFLLKDGILCIPNIDKKYKYYLEVKRFNENQYDYYVLLGEKKFDDNCYNCYTDNYNRLKIRLHKDLKEYCNSIAEYSPNVIVEYIESDLDYDVWQIKG